ncbi:Transmembrane protein 131 [Camellia lanceoleosa]|uniref:Transmembrane protein 131 n=1 Tax=Camellia lanceoleosa TaxID=1840588 RepID=A0ACC0I4L9_9ERIC|nr:Transmembrane protein 131 [Camellia lanceoleosa]
MESLLIRAHLQLSMSCHRRVLFHQARPFYFLVILICTLFCIAACGLCSINGMLSSVEYDLCESCTDNYNPGFQDAYVRDVSSGCVSGMGHLSLENVCSNSNLFCFPSTLPGFLCKGCSPESTVLEVSPVQPGATLPEGSTQARNNLSWSLDYGMFKLLSERAVSCSLNSQDEIHDISSLQTSKGNQNYVSSCGGPFGNQKSPSPNLNENSEMKMIKSGFLDGMSSAHLILQTSSGGFLIQAKGFAVESPYGLRALAGLDVSSSGRWTKKFSLFNPFDETLYVEEVTVWISVSIGNTSHLSKAICRIENFQGSEEHSVLHAKSGQVGSPQMAMGPYRNWDIGPGSTEAVIEIDFTYYAAGKISGAFCMQLLRPSQDKSDTIVVPLEAELGGESVNDLIDAVSVSLETLLPCDSSDTVVVALLLRNGTPHLLNVVKVSLIGESTKLFQIKYKEGLILFPGTDTHVAVVSYIPLPIGLHDYPSESPDINWNCKLVILTNDSSNPQIEMPCKDIVSICSKLDSCLEYERQSGNAENANARTGSLRSGVPSPSLIKEMKAAEPDELVLGNWKSQGTASSMSVLDNHGVVFPMVQIGTHHSEWITVKNPSEQPVVMQLILNAGEIIDECRAPDGLLQPSLSSVLVLSENTSPTRYGFSISEKALTEAYVHPYSTASFGPIIFHPSNRCGWRSSALIRNNLSGVEWLSLRGYGGSFSLDLFEGSKPIPSLEFKFNLPSPLNLSPPEMSHHKEETTHACSKPLSKELYAKNTGDLPLEVRRIEISGTECELDGFVVHTCKGFALEPGESTKLLISYQADFSTVMVQRDLELALATGIVVIPMKASLPLNMLNLCKKSMFRMQVHRIFFTILLAAFVMFLILFASSPIDGLRLLGLLVQEWEKLHCHCWA